MATLNDLIARVAADLGDAGHERWSADELAAHLRRALDDYSRTVPRLLADVLPSVAGVRTYALTTLQDLIAVRDVVYPYDLSSPTWPAERPVWHVAADGVLELDVEDAPRGDGTDDLLVRYAAAHTIEGLDGATASTPGARGEELIVLGAAGYAAEAASLSLIGAVTVGDAAADYGAWARARLQSFRSALRELAAASAPGEDPRVTWKGEV